MSCARGTRKQDRPSPAFQGGGSERFDGTTAARLEDLEGILAFSDPGAAAAAATNQGAVAWPMRWRCRRTGRRESESRAVELSPARQLPEAARATGLAAGVQTFVLGPPHDRGKLLRHEPEREGRGATRRRPGTHRAGHQLAWLASRGRDRPRHSLAQEEAPNLAALASFDSTLACAR